MTKSAAEKIGSKEHMRTLFVSAPADGLKDISSAGLDIKKRLSGNFDDILFFARDQAAFHNKFPALAKHLNKDGMLWVSWPKSRKQRTDLTITIVIKLGYDYGLVESKCISINNTWSALKFTWPKDGKTYNNKYGQLAKTQKP